MRSSPIVIHLGGSAVVPHISDQGGINTAFLKDFLLFVRMQLRRKKRLIIVVGGGKTCRVYQQAARKVKKVLGRDLDWIGIYAGCLNAHLLRALFAKEAYPAVIDHEPSQTEVNIMKRSKRALFFASGWGPGWSHDYVAVGLAKKFGAKEVFIAKDTPFVYDADPKKHAHAKPFKRLSWKAYKKIIPHAWSPGLSTPMDPVATRLAEKLSLTAKIFKAADLKSFGNAVAGKPFEGTTITP